MIEYKVTRWEPQLNCSSHSSCEDVHSVVFGLTATNTETGSTAYVDERVILDPCMPADQLNQQAEQLSETWAGARGFYLTLQRMLFQKDMAPRPMPDSYESPDFENMNIGDGYKEFVITESNMNDQDLVDEVFGDALPTDSEPEAEPTEDAETPTE